MSDWPDRGQTGPPGAGSATGQGDAGDELVEWVDADGTVIEVVTRRRMRAEGLCHRCTYVVVVVGSPDRLDLQSPDRQRSAAASPVPLRPDDELVVHRRAEWKDVCPGYWDLAFGGVCGVGEPWDRSARRELAEEAGITLPPEQPLLDLGPVSYRDPAPGPGPGLVVGDEPSLIGRVFLASWPDEPVSVDGEAVEFGRVGLSELTGWLASVAVCPDSVEVVVPALTSLVAWETDR